MASGVEAMWRESHDKLHGFIQSRVGDAATADDILQDVFLRIHQRLDSLRDESKLQSWMYTITRNAIIDYYRTRKQGVELPEALAAPEAGPSDEARLEMADCAQSMIAALPDNYRQAVMLSEIDGLKRKELAEREGISLSGAKSRVQRGRAMLKDKLLECCRFEFDHRGAVMDYEEKSGGGCPKCSSNCS